MFSHQESNLYLHSSLLPYRRFCSCFAIMHVGMQCSLIHCTGLWMRVSVWVVCMFSTTLSALHSPQSFCKQTIKIKNNPGLVIKHCEDRWCEIVSRHGSRQVLADEVWVMIECVLRPTLPDAIYLCTFPSPFEEHKTTWKCLAHQVTWCHIEGSSERCSGTSLIWPSLWSTPWSMLQSDAKWIGESRWRRLEITARDEENDIVNLISPTIRIESTFMHWTMSHLHCIQIRSCWVPRRFADRSPSVGGSLAQEIN